jgi:hypothetical protein
MSKPDSWVAATLGSGGHTAMCPGIVKCAAILVLLCIGSVAKSGDEKIPLVFGVSGATDARPLSSEWLDYWGSKYPYDDEVGAHLVAELVRSESIDSDSWSKRTEAEIRAAITSDDRLSKNTWNTVRCSRNGCIAAIDPVDVVDNSLITIFRTRLLSQMTPRRSLSHTDFMMVEADTVHGKKIPYIHLLFFLFPERLDRESDEAQSQGISLPSR